MNLNSVDLKSFLNLTTENVEVNKPRVFIITVM